LVIVGHGTGRTPASRRAVEQQVEKIAARAAYAHVRGAFMEDEPRVGDAVATAPGQQVVVVPYFISDGLHVVEDIPVLLGEPVALVRARLAAGRSTWRNPTERWGRRIWYAPGIGFEPLLTEVILERVREATGAAAAAVSRRSV
jgi:sirohydrochlorin cobaltochelatase